MILNFSRGIERVSTEGQIKQFEFGTCQAGNWQVTTHSIGR
jgi:hypothetical protein